MKKLLCVLLAIITIPAVADWASVSNVDKMRESVQNKIDSKVKNSDYTTNRVLQTDSSGNVIADTVGTGLLANNSIQEMHLANGSVTNADLAGMLDILKLNMGDLPTFGKHMMIWNAETQKYVFERLDDGLPEEYMQLEYIESTGTQYINTGVSTEAVVDVNFAITDINFYSDKFAYIYGREVNYEPWHHFGIRSQETAGAITSSYDTGGTTFLLATVPQDTNRHHSVMWDFIDYRKWDYDNENMYTNTATAGVAPYAITLFAENRAGTVDRNSKSRIYSVKIYSDKDMNNLVRNFIPAKRVSDGAIGMYDQANGTFYGNSGSGTFTAGPEI